MNPILSSHLDQLEESVGRFFKEQGCLPVSVPERYHFKADHNGESFQLRSRGYQGSRWTFARTVRIDAGPSMQVFNCVLFPREGTAQSIISCEILIFKKGLHLFALDAYPQGLEKDPAAIEMARLRSELAKIYKLESIPDWGLDVFSDQVTIIKPGLGSKLESHLVQAFLDLLLASIGCRVARTVVDHARRERYLEEHASGEPARPFLAKIAGPEWTDDFITNFLFPQWLRAGDLSPPWLPLSVQLRNSTRPLHKAIEATPLASALLDASLPLKEFQTLMACYRHLWNALEVAFQDSHSPIRSVWVEDMPKVPFLESDLAHLGGSETVTSAMEEAVASAAQMAKLLGENQSGRLLGTLYVLEGSTLGGTILYRQLKQRPDLAGALQYYRPYSGSEGRHWKAFCSRLDAVSHEPSVVVDGANWAFENLRQIFDKIYPGRPVVVG